MGKFLEGPVINNGSLNSVAIIMDGNGRWAKRRGLPRNAGHAAGAAVIESAVRAFYGYGVRYLTLYAFSTENWKRPAAEVDGLMELIYKYLDKVAGRLISDGGFSVRFLGDISALPEKLRSKCSEVERLSDTRECRCNIALNYGGRDEIVFAANSAIRDGITQLDEKTFSRYLYTADTPDPDLIIRTGGEYRISNFLLWQSAYSELIVLDTLWPDFGEKDVEKCISSYLKRKRRFGGLDPQDGA